MAVRRAALRRRSPSLIPVALLVVVLACGDDSTGPSSAPEVVVAPTFFRLVLGASQQLAVTVLDARGQPVGNPPLAYASSDTALVRVSSTGLVTARALGEAVVTVSSGAARAYAGVRTLTPARIVLTPATGAVPLGDTLVFAAQSFDYAGLPVPDAPITFESSDPGVLEVIGPLGRVYGAGLGQVHLRAISGTTKDSAVVLVHGTPTQVTIAPDSIAVTVRLTATLAVDVRDESGQVIPNAAVSFESVDTTVATVTGGGLVTARKVGVTTLVARAGSASDTIPMVGKAVVVLTPGSVLLGPRDTVTLTAVARDGVGAVIPGVTVTLRSTDTTVARVSGTGQLVHTGGGLAQVIAEGGYDSDTTDVTAVIARTPVASRPFGAAASVAGAVYVTQLDAAALTRLDGATGDTVGSIAVGLTPTDVIFNTAGTRAYVTNQSSRDVSVVDPATDLELGRLPIPGDAYIVALAPGDSILYVSANTAFTYVIRLATGAIIDSLETGISYALAIRDTLLYVGLPLDGRVDVYDRRSKAVIRTFATGGRPAGMALSASGDQLYIADEFGDLQRWSTASGTSLGPVTLSPSRAFGVAVQPGTGLVFVTGLTGVVHVVAPATGTVTRALPLGGLPRRIAFRANGDAVVANEGGWVDIIR